jgi:hypothetical protein
MKMDGYQRSQLGFVGSAIGGNQMGLEACAQAAPPRTIASAAGRIESLNERLGTVIEHLGSISAQIGAMTPVNGLNNAKNGQTAACGAVHRLNDAADEAHARLLEIENYIGGIARALG